MIKVTNEMIDAVMRYFNNFENAKQNDRDWIAGAIKISIELHEANKPKPEPFGYFKMYYNELIDCYPSDDGAFALYEAPPTREPLSEELLMALAEECTAQFFNGVHQNATIHFARAIEQAHGIGVTTK